MNKFLVPALFFGLANISMARELNKFEDEKKIAADLGCYAAIGSEKKQLLFCFRDDITDLGLATETKGCSVHKYDLKLKKMIGFSYEEVQANSEKANALILSSQLCADGGLDIVLSLPYDQRRTISDYVVMIYENDSQVWDLVETKEKITFNLVNKINKVPQARGSTEGNNESAQGARAPVPSASPTNLQMTDQKNRTIEVFYGTDRQYTANKSIHETFSDLRSAGAQVTLGTVKVNIPLSHEYANLELPSVFTINVDPDKHFMMKSIERLDSQDFFEKLNSRVNDSVQKDLFVFVHGYNTSFQEAALRTAQMAFDLKFPGAPVFYAWPSESLRRYAIAEKNVEWSLPHLTEFLNDIAQKSGAEKIHLIAHSMGNRALTKALDNLAKGSKLLAGQKFQNVILAAPDLDQNLFRQIERSIKSTTETITLYASSNDVALNISDRIHKNEPRLGQTGGDYTYTSPYIETIDASAVNTSMLGHSYFGDNSNVVFDIENLIMKSMSIALRPGLMEIPLEKNFSCVKPFWKIQRIIKK